MINLLQNETMDVYFGKINRPVNVCIQGIL